MFTNIAEWTAISIIALAYVSLALGVIKNAFSGDACVFEAFRQVLKIFMINISVSMKINTFFCQ